MAEDDFYNTQAIKHRPGKSRQLDGILARAEIAIGATAGDAEGLRVFNLFVNQVRPVLHRLRPAGVPGAGPADIRRRNQRPGRQRVHVGGEARRNRERPAEASGRRPGRTPVAQSWPRWPCCSRRDRRAPWTMADSVRRLQAGVP
jgi:hypothetical protein